MPLSLESARAEIERMAKHPFSVARASSIDWSKRIGRKAYPASCSPSEDVENVIARLRAHGAELVGELAQYENKYRLCYVRGAEGIIVALAEAVS